MILELKDRRNKLMTDASKLAQSQEITNETRSKIDDMLADVDVLEADIARLERVAKFEEEQRSQARPPRAQPGSQAGATDTEAEKRSFKEWVVSGRVPEKRDLGVGPGGGNITGGSQLVAPAFYPILTAAQMAYGGVVNIVNQRKTDTGTSMKLGFLNDTSNGLQTWGEDSAATSVDPSLSQGASNTDLYHTGAVFVTLEELQDSYFDIDAFVRDLMGERLYRGLAKYVSQGSASGNYVSYFAGATSGATSASPTAISFEDIAALYTSLDPAYLNNATFTCSSKTRGALLSTVDSLGRPLFTASTSATGSFDTLLGRPVVLDQYAPSIAAGATALAFGDFRAGYTLRSVGQFEIARDPYTYLISKGAIAFIGYGRGGSFATDAGTHPIKVLTQHA